MPGQKPPWSDLPQELLSAIANFLTSNSISILTFRSICRSWRTSCPPLPNSSILSPLLPLSIPLSPDFYLPFYDSSRCTYLSVTIIYALHRPLGFSSLSPDTWILFVDEFTPGKLSIRKPFLNGSYYTPINFPTNINLIDFNVRELGRFHNRSSSTYYDEDLRFKRSKPRFCGDNLNKVVMFPNSSAAITLSEDGRLGIIECETKHDGKGFRFDDIVEFNGRVLGIDRRGKVYEIKYHSSEMTPFVAPIAGGGGRRKRLVESLGRLYLVVRCYVDPGHNNKLARLKMVAINEGTSNKLARLKMVAINEGTRKTKFKVYELNEGRKKWIEISSLGERSFCFGRNFSFSASVQELGTCGNDCILFTTHSFLSYSWNDDDYKEFPKFKKGDLDICVYHLHNADDFGAIESYPGYPDTLWPLPCWIWPIDRLKRIEIVETAINEILDRIPENFKAEVNRAGDPCDDFGKPAVLEFTRGILSLSKMAIRFQEEENEFMNKLQETMDVLNQVDNLFELARTRTPWAAEGRLGWPDSFNKGQACHGRLLRSTKNMLHLRNAHLLHMEERATQLEMSMNSQFAPMLT